MTLQLQCTQDTFFKMSGPALGPTKLPIQWVVGDFSKGLKPLTCETDHLPSSSANINKEGGCPSVPPVCLMGMSRDNFCTFSICLTHEIFLHVNAASNYAWCAVVLTLLHAI
jgi:hypothetical protein